MVKSEDDSGLDTLWLLKKIAFLSAKEAEEKGEVVESLNDTLTCISHLRH